MSIDFSDEEWKVIVAALRSGHSSDDELKIAEKIQQALSHPQISCRGKNCIRAFRPVWALGKVFVCPECGRSWAAAASGRCHIWS